MKNWQIILFDSCDLCAGDLEYLTSCKKKDWFNDGDPIRCKSCGCTGIMHVDHNSSTNYTVDWAEDEIDSGVIVKALQKNTKEKCAVKWCRSGLKPVVYVFADWGNKKLKVGVCEDCNNQLHLKEGDPAPEYEKVLKLFK